MNNTLFEHLGLSENEISIYSTLVREGGLPASQTARRAGRSRVVTYQTLDSLELKGLITRKPAARNGIMWFYPAHPRLLADLARKREEQVKSETAEIVDSIGSLVSQYNSHAGLPNVKFFEGIQGLKALYEDILEEGSDIMLLRSPFDNDFPEFKDMVSAQITAQISESIHTRAIVPRYDQPNRISLSEQDARNLVERREYNLADFQIPAQIIIYANKVGISQFTNPASTTILESAPVATTFRILFEIFWKHSMLPE
jgi:sugar-specific transcriptional regulator TrmB